MFCYIYCVHSIGISNTVFNNNRVNHRGGAIHCFNSKISFQEYSSTVFNNSTAVDDGGAVFFSYCYINFAKYSFTVFSNNTAKDTGGAICSYQYYISFQEYSSTVFNNNIANRDGGAIYFSVRSHIFFKNSSFVLFNHNSASRGGAIYFPGYDDVSFEDNSYIVFSNNTANYGGAIYTVNNGGTFFKSNSSAVFSNNLANKDGGAMYFYKYNDVSFKEDSSALFSNNTANGDGGAIYIHEGNYISFEENSSTVFSHNFANNSGGAMYVREKIRISFKGNSATMFSKNSASLWGGAINCYYVCYISFENNSSTLFINNAVTYLDGGAIRIRRGRLTFKWYSSSVFTDNYAKAKGGAVCSETFMTFEEHSSTKFTNNTARDGGAISCYTYSVYYTNKGISFKGNSVTLFNNNAAKYGGAIHTLKFSVSFEETSNVIVNNNNAAVDGGAIHDLRGKISFIFKDHSSVVFNNNNAKDSGGAISKSDGKISFEGNSFTEFKNNNAQKHGGALYVFNDVDVYFAGSSTTIFDHNTAVNHDGGAIYSYQNMSFTEDSKAIFSNNSAYDGGAIYSAHRISFEGSSSTEFDKNYASNNGGGIFFKFLYVTGDRYMYFKENSFTLFSNNIAVEKGGGMYSQFIHNMFYDFSNVVFENNTAQYGGAVSTFNYCFVIFSDHTMVTFTNNRATFGGTLYGEEDCQLRKRKNSIVIINGHAAKWCRNSCLEYLGHGTHSLAIDSNGVAWCNYFADFFCESEDCNCRKLQDFLVNNTVNITDRVVTLSSHVVIRYRNFMITGHNNPTVICAYSGRLVLTNYTNVTIKGITWMGCGGNDNVKAPAIHIQEQSPFKVRAVVRIQNCSFQYSLAPAIGLLKDTFDVNIIIKNCIFMNSIDYTDHGVAVYFSSNRGKVLINNCNLNNNGVAKSIIYIEKHSLLTSESSIQIHINNSHFFNNQGVPVHLSNYVELYIHGTVWFENNVADYGAGIYASDHSTVVFDKNSVVTFNDNKATNGTIHSKDSCNVIFKANSNVTFDSNSAAQYGAAVYSVDNSNIIHTEGSQVKFINNLIPLMDTEQWLGGTIFSEAYSSIYFENNSITVFRNNSAPYGAAIFSYFNSNINFKDKSRVEFKSNIGKECGILTAALFTTVTFNDNTEVTYNGNTVLCATNIYGYSYAGAICAFKTTNIIVSGHSFLTFYNNTADKGGAVTSFESKIIIEKHSTVRFHENFAITSGGAFECSNKSVVTIAGSSLVTFTSNKARQHGGAIDSSGICLIIFKGNSTTKFVNNHARYNGGVVFGRISSVIAIEGNSQVAFDSNTANNGGALYLTNSIVTFREASEVSFHINAASRYGGAGYFTVDSEVVFEGFTNVKFHKNTAAYGGAIIANYHSNVSTTGNSVLTFISNAAEQTGGAAYFYYHCNVTMKSNADVILVYNKALQGGALFVDDRTNLIFEGNSTSLFKKNKADVGGGAVKVLNRSCILIHDHININFTMNSAQYGGAVFLDATATIINNSSGKKYIHFNNNSAFFKGNTIYQEGDESCNKSCITSKVVGINNELIATPPNDLKFYDPAVCINNNKDVHCNTYYVKNIMLGEEIIIPACVLDYHNNRIIDSVQFLNTFENNLNYFMTGPKQILISCDAYQGIQILGNKSLSAMINFTVNISLNVDHDANWKQITNSLIVGLSPCHPGFWQYPESKICECYKVADIVFCSGGSSTIKRGYWFGTVNGKPTITFCPINYCDFTCCETSNGYYHLSPIRDNQCKSHRSGVACGICSYGYTLSYDSTECVNIEKCAVGQTILMIALTVIYWIIIIILVFAVMYHRVRIGYFYCITYYYSVADTLLSQNVYGSRRVHFTTNMMSSIFKITPQFLGEFCLTTGMSGIDQQFIHYIHPSAVIFSFIAITFLAKKSSVVGVIISRGRKYATCLLLLLLYTSIISTSLLLIRSLTFHEIDTVYTYLSPEIEYFHGRHLIYGIIAFVCIISIVIGLPLLLIIEPFISHKISFIRIQSILDQFQGCYKVKYRCFASYYMICRILIEIIIIANVSNEYDANYMLMVVNGIVALVHVSVEPYNNEVLNKLDGIILHLIILVNAVLLFSDSNNLPSTTTVSLFLLIIPLFSYIAVMLFLFQHQFKKIISRLICNCKHDHEPTNIPASNIEIPMKEFEVVIDDTVRVNTTVLDMYVFKYM